MSFVARLVLAMTTVMLISATAVGWWATSQVGEIVAPIENSRLETRARAIETILNGRIEQGKKDLRILRDTTAIRELAEIEGNPSVENAPRRREIFSRLSTYFRAMLKAVDSYQQMRLIGTVDNRRELVRVDRRGPQNQIEIVPQTQLQYEENLPYFNAGLNAGEGFYESPINLKKQNGLAEDPRRAVVRIATPILDLGSRPTALLILNITLDDVLSAMRGTDVPGEHQFLVDHDGNFLVHSDRSREFGYELGKPYLLTDEFPALRDAWSDGSLLSGVHSQQVKDGAETLRLVVVPIKLPGGTELLSIATSSQQLLNKARDSFIRLVLACVVLVVVSVAVLSYLVAKKITRPLIALRDGVDHFTLSNAIGSLPTTVGGELGALARAFEAMIQSVKEKTSRLEKEIVIRSEAEKRAEQLSADSRLLALIVQSSNVAIISVDLHCKIKTWNIAAERLYQYSAKEILDKDVLLLSIAEYRDDFHQRCEQAALGNGLHQFESTHVSKLGATLNVEVTVSPMRLATEVTGISIIVRDVTELRANEERFRIAVEAAPNGMVMVDQHGRIVLVNSEALRLFGYRRDELLDQSIELLVPSRHRSGHVEVRGDYILHPSSRLMGEGRDLFGLRKDGTEFPVEIGLRPVETSSGRCVIAAINDLTARRNAEELFHLAVEASPSGMIVVDAQGQIVLVNAEAMRLFGYNRTELMQLKIESLVPKKHQATHVGTRRNYLAHPSVRPMGIGRDLSGRRKDGSEFPLEIGLRPVMTASGPCVIAVVTDLTSRKAVEALREEAARTQAHLAAIVESSEDAIIGKDENSIVVTWNVGAEKLFGYTAQEMVGQSILKLFPPDRVEEEAAFMAAIFVAGEDIQQRDSMRVAKNGRLIDVSITLSPIRDKQDRLIGISSVARDISKRKRAEAQLRARSEELSRSNNELEQFAYSASHDLQEPLRAVAGCAQLLRKRYGGQLDARADEYIDHAVDGAKRMQQLIDDLLAYSRVGARRFETSRVNCNEILNRAKANLQTAITETGAIIESDDLPELEGDRAQLTQLLQNLMGNAIKFHRELPPKVTIRYELRGNEHVFAISDNGIGIEERHFERIFGVFQRLHTRVDYPGTGIGLALCAKIVAAHGGRIWVESQLMQGSTFSFTLPVVSERDAA